jgi:large subunit ribosomal protein L6
MSRIGKLPVDLPQGVEVTINGQEISVKGPKGSLTRTIHKGIKIEQKDNRIVLALPEGKGSLRPFYGTERALVANMVKGVSDGWSKQMELIGTGYRAEVNGSTLSLTVGYSHPIKVEGPEGISFKVEKNVVTVMGIDKEMVGLISARIRAVRPPEPYKGKGIKYVGEIIRRKAGKAAKTAGGA